MRRIRIITLDLDDTLWSITPVIRRAEQALWHWLGEHYPRITAEWDAERMRILREEVVTEFAERSHDLRFLRCTVLARMAADSGYGEDLVEPAFRVFDEHRNRVTLYPDVAPNLERLARDYPLVALTNGNACLERIGIRHHFHDVVTAVDAGAAKPDARIFDAACARAGVRPPEALHVGDHPHYDVAGARAAGMRTAWVNRHGDLWPGDLEPPDATVRSIAELADWLTPGSAAGRELPG